MIIAARFCLALASLAPPKANCKASCAVNHTRPSDVVPTLTAPTRVPEIFPKSTSAILSTSNTLLVSGAAAAPPPDMASTTMEADSTARAHKKQRRGDMRGAQHADATQQLSATINRRVPDKTHTRQPVPELCGLSTFANGRHVGDPPPRAHMEIARVCLSENREENRGENREESACAALLRALHAPGGADEARIARGCPASLCTSP